MRVLLISLFSHMPHHVATDLEILQRHIDEDDDVTVLACMGYLPGCLHKDEDNPARCHECIITRNNSLRLLDRMPTMYALDSFYTEEDRAREESLITSFDSLDAIRDYFVDDFDLGYAALSSAVSLCRDPHLENSKDRELFSRLIVSAYRTFCSTREFLKQHPEYDRAYMFNGRFATLRGALRACQQAELDVHIHERGSNNSKFMIFENSMPHDIDKMTARINRYWDESTEEEKQTLAQSFYENRRKRVEEFWHSHTKAQCTGRLPASWDDSKKNVVIYTSSDDEYVAIAKEWVTPGFKSQTDAILTLHKNLRERNSDTQLYVRMHPNLRGISNRDTRPLLELKGEGIEVIPPESNVCSYTMMEECDRVVTFGSTIGIESTFWGKPSILAGMHFYRALDGAHVATGDEKLYELVEQDPLEPKPIDGALKFGLYVKKFGQPFKYYESANFETGKFRGTMLKTGMRYSPFGFLLPAITRKFGSRPSVYKSVERVTSAIGYYPFRWAYDIAMNIRKSLGTKKALG